VCRIKGGYRQSGVGNARGLDGRGGHKIAMRNVIELEVVYGSPKMAREREKGRLRWEARSEQVRAGQSRSEQVRVGQ
jgi:hypothetical protein